jgi:ssDNA-binding Zn-finger/Zn-ribbon topoisomerase 1
MERIIPSRRIVLSTRKVNRMPNDPRERSKICPKCPDSQTMIKTDRVFIIPELGDKSRGEAISSRAGAPVQAYECPRCRFVELYHCRI